jgi:hypothetical protein
MFAWRAALPLAATGVLAVALSACGGSTRATQTTAGPVVSAATLSAHTATAPPATAAPARRRHRRTRLEEALLGAQETYHSETHGPKLHLELARIAHDRVLLEALSRGDVAGAQAEADAQLHAPVNHLAHVTRIGVDSGSRALVNATVNSDGVFVAAPAQRALRLHGRTLGTLLVSIQDITGMVKLVHRQTGADILARGAGGEVRTSLPVAVGARRPPAGPVQIGGVRYFVRSFGETAWGNEAAPNEALTVWVLVRA